LHRGGKRRHDHHRRDTISLILIAARVASRLPRYTGGAEALVLERAVAELALPVEEHGPAQRIAGLALVQPGVAALT